MVIEGFTDKTQKLSECYVSRLFLPVSLFATPITI